MSSQNKPFREIVNGELIFRWHEGQKRVLQSKAQVIAMLAGTQAGKTVTGSRWLHNEIMRTADPAGGNDYLAGTANYDLFKLKMLPELLFYFEQTLKVGRYYPGDQILEIAENFIPGKFWAKRVTDPMWARIILRSAKAEGGWESGTARAAWLDEAGHKDFNLTAWEGCRRRLSIHQGRILITTTLYNLGWLKTEVYDRWIAGDKSIEVIQFDSTLNPAFKAEEYERARSTMPTWKFDMLYRGRYAKPAGLIYDSFNEICIIDRFPIPKNWLIYV
ncbi:MAG: terminase family protein, partial [Dehalococcoidales bacterium]|nr:terminase family protein [Dehalococcoidales bacterium]